MSRPALSREQVLAHRRRACGLVERSSCTADGLRRAAWLGLTDSMPRAALLSLHARVAGITSDALAEPRLVQVWGPRYSVYVVDERDVAVFTLGRLPTDDRGRTRAHEMAERLTRLLDGHDPVPFGEAGRALGVHHNALRYASPTGVVRLRWDGARQPTIRVVPPPDVDPREARHELVRRYVHVMGPTTPTAFGEWAGIRPRSASATFDELADELLAVRTPLGDAWILAADEASCSAEPAAVEPVRLLPSGDAYWLLQGAERRLLVEDAARREQLWTPRVWPGAVLVGGEVVGTWRRAGDVATVSSWRTLSTAERSDVEREAASMPLPDLDGPVRVTWDA